MPDSDTGSVARTPDDPQPASVLEQMDACEPYTVADLAPEFEASRWTVQRRLDTLVERGEVSKKKHAENRVSYWIPA